MKAKNVYYDLRLLDGVKAATTLEAAKAAVDAGASFDPESGKKRSEHIVEGPLAFYVAKEPGGKAVPDAADIVY